MEKLNGWINVAPGQETPESGEQVVTLSYCGPTMSKHTLAGYSPFEDPENRDYGVAWYYYAGDIVEDECMESGLSTSREVEIERDGFYVYDYDTGRGVCRWRRLADCGQDVGGVMFWKRLDWPEFTM